MAVNLGCNVLTLQEIKLSTKQQMKRMKRKKRPGEAPDDSGDDEAANPADGTPSHPSLNASTQGILSLLDRQFNTLCTLVRTIS